MELADLGIDAHHEIGRVRIMDLGISAAYAAEAVSIGIGQDGAR